MLDFHRWRRQQNHRPPYPPELRRSLSLGFMGAVALVVLYQMGREPGSAPIVVDQRVAANATSMPAAGAEDGPVWMPPKRRLFGGVPANIWQDVRDDTPLRPAENKAFFSVLHALRETPLDKLAEQSSGPVAYTQLIQQPKAYRGELVTLVGRVRRAFRLQAAQNELGIESLYQIWLEPADLSEPVVIYLAELPQGFPEGLHLDEQITAHVVFFKRWPYRAASGLRSAPMLLGGSFSWQPSTLKGHNLQDGGPHWKPMLVILGTSLLGLVLVVLLVRSWTSLGASTPFRLGTSDSKQTEVGETAPDPRAFLQQLAQAEHRSHDV